MNSLNEVLAQLLDKLKASSPIAHLLVTGVLAAIVQFLGGDAGIDTTTLIDFFINWGFGFILGSRTIRHIPGKAEALRVGGDDD